MNVLASDFDNTLFFKNSERFKESDIKRIKEFQKDGHLFGICSGRPFSGLLRPMKGILKPDFFIVSTGGAILDKDYHLLYGKTVPFDIAHEIYLTYQKETELIVQTLSQDKFYCTNIKEDGERTKIHSVLDMKDEDIYSISLIESTVERATQITLEINQKYQEVEAFQNVDSIDIVAKGCSKGEAIIKLKEIFHFEQIAGIGDSYNDLPMLDVVDTSFTFLSSPQSIQDHADYIVEDIEEAINILCQKGNKEE